MSSDEILQFALIVTIWRQCIVWVNVARTWGLLYPGGDNSRSPCKVVVEGDRIVSAYGVKRRADNAHLTWVANLTSAHRPCRIKETSKSQCLTVKKKRGGVIKGKLNMENQMCCLEVLVWWGHLTTRCVAPETSSLAARADLFHPQVLGPGRAESGAFRSTPALHMIGAKACSVASIFRWKPMTHTFWLWR